MFKYIFYIIRASQSHRALPDVGPVTPEVCRNWHL